MNSKFRVRFSPEVVNGHCPTCEEHTLLVSITRDQYRCVTCGADLEQHINGKISYIPTLNTNSETKGKYYLHDWGEKE
jgi:ribosomal protein S27E